MPEIIPNWHPIFVHFTVALLAFSVGLFVVTQFMSGPLKEQWLIVTRWALWFGAGITLITGLAGLDAYNSVAHDTPSHAAMTEHRNWAISVIALFSLLAVWAALRARAGRALGKVFIALILAGGLLLASTAWHGGELVYRFGLGVMSLPKPEGKGHDHSHGDDGHAPAAADHGHNHDEGSATRGDAPMDFSGMDKGVEDTHQDAEGHTEGHTHDGGEAHDH